MTFDTSVIVVLSSFSYINYVLQFRCSSFTILEITEHPRNLNVSVGQENVNLSCKFDSETHLVDWAYSLHNTKLLDFGISNLAGNPGVAAR